MSQFAVLPDPGQARTLDEVTGCLRLLKTWAGNPSYEMIAARVNAVRPAGEQVGKTTVVDCFRAGRRRLDPDLVVAVVEALHADVGYTTQWRQALRVVSGESRPDAQVRVLNTLPDEPPGYIGRTTVAPAEVTVLAGMAGAGKTSLAVHLAHTLAADTPYDRVLAVNLRGCHPDQPPVEPGAVLDGFLRLLGMAGQHVPLDLSARTTAFRLRLTGVRTLILLDDAADEAQVRPLLPGVPGSITVITTRRRLDGLTGALHVPVDVFTPSEARAFLRAAVPGIPAGPDPVAVDRISRTCGYLPLALSLVTGHMRKRPGWTLTDHADWLAERCRTGRLDPGVQAALDVSYRNLTPRARELLRLLAHHPARTFDRYAAKALTGACAEEQLRELARHHLIRPATTGRWSVHDLVRVYAAGRSADEDRRTDRRAALTRLLDHLLTAPEDPADLSAAADFAAAEGWPSHAARLHQRSTEAGPITSPT
ncbi:MAG: NB-ARC domain-containing protein [Actinomycetota bacterium]|nr:NB-ARC domain-containing protein [Actinomycetota bacterium]